MADRGHEITDEILNDLEKRIAQEYEQASREVKQKLEDYLERFKAKDAIKKKQVENGTLTKKEYLEWRKGQILIGKRWEEMSRTLAQDYVNTNYIARQMIKQDLPNIYAVNHDYATFQIEHDSMIDTSYTLYNRRTVENLIRDNPKLLPDPVPGSKTARMLIERKDLRWNQQHITSVVTQGVLQGESISKIAKRLQTVTDMNHSAAVRNARTMVTGAQNKGRTDSYDDLRKKGINIREKWISTLDGRTRESHRWMHGEYKDPETGEYKNGLQYPGDPDGEPEEVYNCFTGETKVASDCEIIRSYKHLYSGKLISVKTTGGIEFTCTPNHPILTLSGWIPACQLNQIDNVLVAFLGDKMFPGRNPNIHNLFSSMDAIHDLLDKVGSKGTRTLGVNFHGDIPTAEVEIVTQERLLRNDRNPNRSKTTNKFILKLADKALLCKRSFVKHFRRIFGVSPCNLRFFYKAHPFFFWRIRHPQIHGLRPISWSDITFSEKAIDYLTGKPVLLSECFDRNPGKIFVDNIVDFRISEDTLHVYNLQTENEHYFVNSNCTNGKPYNGIAIIAHNCRCTEIGEVEGFEIETPKYSPKMGDMTFEEWRGEKQRSIIGANYYTTQQARATLSQADTSTIQKADNTVIEIFKNIFPGYKPAPLVKGDDSETYLLKPISKELFVVERTVSNIAHPPIEHVDIGNPALANSIHERIHDVVNQIVLNKIGISDKSVINWDIASKILDEQSKLNQLAYLSAFGEETLEEINTRIFREISQRAIIPTELYPESAVAVLGLENPSELARIIYNTLVEEWKNEMGT